MHKGFVHTLLLCALASSFAYAQLTRGFISGTVQDASGAVIPEVTVKITNKGTNLTSEMVTGNTGVYRFVAVEPGTYSIEFTKPGFETRRVEGVNVSTSQEVTVNQQLPVGTASTTIEVQETPPGVELAKTTATIDRTLPTVVIESIPLTGATRDVNVLALLAPTVTRGPGSSGISVNGNRARNNNFMLDGVDNNDASVSISSMRIIPEQLGEYQIQTSPYSAEFGRGTGGQMNAITKSGTNEFHGTMWNYYRGNWMQPLSLNDKRAGVKSTPRFVHNQPGGSFGGPIIKDKTFFFGLIETNRRFEAPSANNASSVNIPTAAGYAALQSVPLVAGQTQASRQSALDALKFLPEIHQQIGGVYQSTRMQNINGIPIEIGTARIPLANPIVYWTYVARADHRLTESNQLSYRMALDKGNWTNWTSNLGFGDRWVADQTNFSQNHAMSLISSITPRFINEARFGYVRRNLDFPERDPLSPTVGISGFFTIGGASNFPQGRVQNVFQWQDIATLITGRHSLRVGADIRRTRLFNRSGFDSKGTWTFNSLQDFVNNQAFRLAQAVNESTFDARQLQTFFFVQDDIKATRDLTLNLGLRYEWQNIPFGFFGAANDQIAAAGVPRNVEPDKNNWGPRAGFAYSPSTEDGFFGRLFGGGKTVFRGGFGINYDVLFFNILTVTASNYPRVLTSETFAPQTSNLFPTLAPRVATLPPFNPRTTSFVNANTDMQNPAQHFWSFSVQREVARGNIFEWGYSGNRGYHGIRQGQLNPSYLSPEQAATVRGGGTIPGTQDRRINPSWGARTTIESTANSKYHGTFLRFDRRFTNGLVIGANYTFSKLMSDNDESLAVAGLATSSPQVPQNYWNMRNEWARSAFDVPHRLAIHYVYQLPGRDASNWLVRSVLGGWQVGGLHEWQSGQPFTIRTGVDTVGQGSAAGSRPDWNPSGIFTKDPVEGNFRTFVAPVGRGGAFVTPVNASNTPIPNSDHDGGNLGRNTFRGPYFKNTNLSISKMFRVTERWSFELRNDLINAFNQRNFGNPVVAMNAANFGENTSDPGGRTMLLGAKIRF